MANRIEVVFEIEDAEGDTLFARTMDSDAYPEAILSIGGAYLTRDDAKALAAFLIAEAGE